MSVFFLSELSEAIQNHVHNELEEVAKAINNEKHLLPAKVKQLWKSLQSAEAVVLLSADMKIVGYSRLTPLIKDESERWYELGTSWVRSDCRGMGFCQQMYDRLLTRHSEKNILATTTNASALAVGTKCGFITVPRKILPTRVWRASCVCPAIKTGVPAGLQQYCKLAQDEPQLKSGCDPCCFRITRATAERLGLV